MSQKNTSGGSPVGRRIRLSSREIVATVLLTVAAVAAIVAYRIGTQQQDAQQDTVSSKPVASDVRRQQ